MFVEHKEALEITEAPAKTLKLSEAIRKGARLRPQGTGWWHRDGKSCALGAAYEALTGRITNDYSGVTLETIHIMATAFPAFYALTHEIGKMNDIQHLTREQIADWLEAQGL
jgi:hypothetical protein